MVSNGYLQAPADGVGKKIQTVNETIGGNDVHTGVQEAKNYQAYSVILDVTPAASKRYLTILNTTGSGRKVRIQRAYILNMTLSELSSGGGDMTMTWSKITARSGGSSVSAMPQDSDNVAVPAQVQISTADTAATADSAPAEIFKMKMSVFETANIVTDVHERLSKLQERANPLNHHSAMPSHQPYSIPEGKGIMLQQGAESVTAGTVRVFVMFELY